MQLERPHKEAFLRRFFYQLRRAGFSLGLSEYELMLQALAGGFGLDGSKTSLLRICKLLWLSSEHDKNEFEFLFHETWEEGREKVEHSDPTRPKEADDPKAAAQSDELQPTETPPSSKDEQEETEREQAEESLALESNDQAQVMQAQLLAQEQEAVPMAKSVRFSLEKDYLPVTSRRMQQRWRRLRRVRREGPLTELDIPASVSQICQDGYFLAPVLRPARQNVSRLILLLDVKGSMIAFEALGERLKSTAQQAGYLRDVQAFYFYNCPDQWLFETPALRGQRKLEEVLHGRQRSHTSLMVFSDAGAARGSYDPDRLAATKAFLREQLPQAVRTACWLNPMPAFRWPGTSAEALARQVAMFEANAAGFRQAIRHLQQ